jgi:carboxymethylenebutenolidase
MREALGSGTAIEVVWPSGVATRGLVVAPDIMGLRPLFDALCTRLANEHGWAVAAVEPFAGREAMPLEDRLAAPQDDARLLDDLIAAADRLATERTAVLGFCMGGSLAFKAAGTGRFDRAVGFYGMLRTPDQWRSDTTVEPLEQLARPEACPTLALLGGIDRWTPAADIDAARAIESVEVVVYPDADHGFVHDADRPAHRPADAADAWARVASFLE